MCGPAPGSMGRGCCLPRVPWDVVTTAAMQGCLKGPSSAPVCEDRGGWASPEVSHVTWTPSTRKGRPPHAPSYPPPKTPTDLLLVKRVPSREGTVRRGEQAPRGARVAGLSNPGLTPAPPGESSRAPGSAQSLARR